MRSPLIGMVLVAALAAMLPAEALGSPDRRSPSEADIVPAPPATPPDQETDLRAREIFLRGDRLFSQGEYEQALEHFEESYRLSGRPRILFAIANTYERLARYEEALLVLRRYAPDAHEDDAADVRARIRALEERVAAQRRAEREAAAGDEAAGDEAAGDEAAARVGERAAPPVDTGPRAAPRGRPLAGWILSGAGAAALGTGIAFGLVARDAKAGAGASCREAANGSTLCLPDARQAFDRNRLYARLADASLAAGAAALIAGAIVLVASGGEGAPAEQPRITIGPGSLEVSIAGRF